MRVRIRDCVYWGLGSVLGFGGTDIDLVAYCGVGGAGCAVASYDGS